MNGFIAFFYIIDRLRDMELRQLEYFIAVEAK